MGQEGAAKFHGFVLHSNTHVCFLFLMSLFFSKHAVIMMQSMASQALLEPWPWFKNDQLGILRQKEGK